MMPAWSWLLVGRLAWADYEIFVQRYSADPAPMEHEGRMWIYTSHDNAQPGYTMTDYNALSSDDLVNWRDEGIVFSLEALDWCDYAWAQQVIKLPNGTFVMYYAAWCSGRNPNCTVPGVGVAYAEGPAGPFVDVLGAPIMPGDDPGAFIEPDDPETVVLCSNVRPDQSPGNYGPLCGLLEADMVTWRAPPAVMPSFNLSTWRFYEAPWLSKIRGRYYLSYMMHGTDLGYSVSDEPMGNYTPMGALMWTPPYDCDDVATANNSQGYGPNNHQGMIEFPRGSDTYYLAYHNRKLQQDRSLAVRARNVALDRMYVNESDGALLPVTSTPRWLRPVKYLDPFVRTPAFTMASCSDGVDTAFTPEEEPTPGARPLSLANLTDGAFVRVRAADFGPGPAAVVVRVATKEARAELRVQVGEESASVGFRDITWRDAGPACALGPTGGAWASVTCALDDEGLSGVVDEFRFVFATKEPVKFAWWRFDAPGPRPRLATPPTKAPPVAVAVAAVGAGGNYLVCRGADLVAAGDSERDRGAQLSLVDDDDGSYRLRCLEDGAWMTACASGTDVVLEADVDDARACGKWRLQGISNGPFYALQSWLTGAWLVARADGALAVDAHSYMLGPEGNERNVVDAGSHFRLRELNAPRA